jgi:hypothetical protein
MNVSKLFCKSKLNRNRIQKKAKGFKKCLIFQSFYQQLKAGGATNENSATENIQVRRNPEPMLPERL